ncbi:saccharopine dehydrogenase family protein [Kineococcus sp. SYSU DK001]|uniref:saccharopine dehydrogenase family protein n=1 Tax=Kineococcus sp. SYSU DK001 TaxID=3383122 RepID=UPI003D7C6249
MNTTPAPAHPVEPLVVVLGADGAVGRALAEVLVEAGGVPLRLVDTREGGMGRFAGPGVEVVVRDVFAPGAAEEVLAGATLLVNCLSLLAFDEVFDMALRAGVDYADLISEPSEQNARDASARGITVVPGLGMSPGLTNVLVAHAATGLRPEEVDILFVVQRAMASSRGALDTMLWEGGEHSPERSYHLDGRLVPVGPFDGGRVVDFGPGFGEQEVFFRPHPEPKSLPRNFPSIRYAAVRGCWQPEAMTALKVLNELGLLAQDTVDATREAIWNRIGGREDPRYHGQSASRVEVRGVSADGRRVQRTYTVRRPFEEHSYTLTGKVAALGVKLLARQARTTTGVVDPEVCFDPEEFLREVEEQGVVRVSWTDEPWTAEPHPAA